MNKLDIKQKKTGKLKDDPKQVVRAIAALIIPFYPLIAGTSSYAIVPTTAKIARILGPNDLGIRRGPQRQPADMNTVLNRGQELVMSGSNRTFAQLNFYNSSDQPIGLAVEASTKNKLMTLYYFPCTFLQGDSLVINWLNQAGGTRGCERGIRLQPGRQIPGLGTQLSSKTEAHAYAFQPLKQVLKAQGSHSRFQRYCSVLADSGRGWLGVKSSGDPCQEPLQECQASGGECAAVTLDNWTVKDSDLTALVECANNQQFTAKGTGSTMKEQVNQLWQQAQAQGATSCDLRVVGAKDVVVSPLPSGEETLIQTRNTDAGIVVEVTSGAASVRSAKTTAGVSLKRGQKYTYSGENAPDKQEKFDPVNESIEVQVFRAPERGLKLCDQEQVSGGQAGDTRTIQLTSTEGKLDLSYEMYEVKDSLQVIYEGRDLLNTGFVSGSNTVSIPIKGNSGQVKVILTGNPGIETTQWKYTLSCPQ